MKVYRNGIELENATVEYGKDNKPEFVTANGLRQHAKHFVFEDDEPKKKTKKPAVKKDGLITKVSRVLKKK